MLVAYRLAGLSALEAYYVRLLSALTQSGARLRNHQRVRWRSPAKPYASGESAGQAVEAQDGAGRGEGGREPDCRDAGGSARCRNADRGDDERPHERDNGEIGEAQSQKTRRANDGLWSSTPAT